MAGFNISLSLNERQRAQQKLTSRSVFPFPLFFRRPSTVFFIDSETNETIPLHFRNVFHLFSEKNSLSKAFLVECVRSGAAIFIDMFAPKWARGPHNLARFPSWDPCITPGY